MRLAVLTLFAAALIRRKRLLIVVARLVLMSTAHICRSRRKLIVVFLPLSLSGGVGGHHLPLLFNGLTQLALVVTLKMSHLGCGVSACATAVPALPSGQIWPSPERGACTSGATPGRGGRAGMVSFGAISVVSAMVVRVIWRVARLTCCRVYVKSGTNV